MADGKKLNHEQLAAVTHKEGPLLIIAGAGTGKTTVITERIKWFILKKKIHPSDILALTFTEKAAAEMEERVDQALPYGYTQMWISTFHSFCDRVLRQEGFHIGLDPSFRLMTEAETILFLRKHLFEFDLDYFRPLGNPTKFLEGLLQHFSRLKDEDISPEAYLKYVREMLKQVQHDKVIDKDESKKSLELANAFQKYEILKAKEGVMDFADLISNTLKLFRTRKNVLADYQKKFQYILIDEFQDTNYAQNELAIQLAGEKKNITVVGDDDQAIYRWRGAALSNIIQFRKRFQRAKIITLTKNYRSTKEILDKAYALIQQNNPDRLEIREKIQKKLISIRNIKGDPIALIHEGRVENEAEQVAQKIKEVLKDKKCPWKDIAILVRANDHAESFVRTFSRLGIPYQFLGPGQLFRQIEVKNLIAYLKVLYNFEDTVSLYRVLGMDIFDLKARDVAAILTFARRKNFTLFEALEHVNETFVQDEVKKKVEKIFLMINRHLEFVQKETAGQILYYFLEDTGLLRKIADYKTVREEKIAQNTARFFDKLKTYETEHEDAGVASVVEWIDLSMQMGESPQANSVDWTEIDAVNILTVHSSKGLEFPIVFLVNLVSERFPTRQRLEKIPIPDDLIKEILPTGDYHMQEERRLFYVGMTRARDLLFFSCANFYGEGKRIRKISSFVYETLGEDQIKKSAIQQLSNTATSQLTLLEWKPQLETTMNNELITKLHIDYLSFSQLEIFDICPMHYKARYILRLPVPQNSAQSFGTSIHATLREFYKQLLRKEKIGKEQLFTLLQKNWINEGYQGKKHEQFSLERGKRMLNNFYEKFQDAPPPIALELPFKFKIQNLSIGGKIDRIDKTNGGIEITDYKTGTRIPSERDLANSLQMTIYALAANKVHDGILGRKPQEVKLSFYFLEEGIKVTSIRTKEQLEEAKKTILEKAKKISESEFLCSKTSMCEYCEYKMLCG